MSEGFWSGKKILVTGAYGFIGSNLTRFLINHGAEVYTIYRSEPISSLLIYEGLQSKIRAFSIDLTDVQSVVSLIDEFEIEFVFHLAAQVEVGIGLTSPYTTFESNIRGTYSLLEACRLASRTPKSIIVASTDKSYGSHPASAMPYTEQHTLNAKYPYDVSKAAADMIARSYSQAPFSLPIVVTRFANIYGPGQLNFSAIFPSLFRHAYSSVQFIPRSDGSQMRDFLFVGDVILLYASISKRLYENPDVFGGKIINAGSGSAIKIREVIELVNKRVNFSDYVEIVQQLNKNSRLKHEIDIQYMGHEQAKEHFGWEPKTNLEEGIDISAKWYQGYFK